MLEEKYYVEGSIKQELDKLRNETDRLEKENWATQDVHDMVMELADLARLAESQGQVILVWMHPLLT